MTKLQWSEDEYEIYINDKRIDFLRMEFVNQPIEKEDPILGQIIKIKYIIKIYTKEKIKDD